MMLYSILKQEMNKFSSILPFCYRFAVKRNNVLSASFTSSAENRIEKEKNTKLEENPFFAKYAEKILKAKETSGEPGLRKHEVKGEDNEILQLKKKIEMSKLQDSEKEKQSSFAVNPKHLKDVVNIDLLMKHNADEISGIWSQYHNDKSRCVYAVIPAEKYEKLYSTGKQFPLFIYPIPRSTADSSGNESKSCYEFVFGQFSNHQIFFTPLLTYQTHKENAPPAMVVHHYPELQRDKKIVLMSGEYDDKVFSLLEAQCLANQIQLFYCNEDVNKKLLLYKFNREPNYFNFMDVINEFENSLVIK